MTDEDASSEPPPEAPPVPDRGPGSRRRRWVFLGIWGALIVAALWIFRAVLLPFVLAIVVAYVLAPLVALMQRIPLGSWRMPRWVAVLTLYTVVIGVLSLLVAVGVPRIVAETERLMHDAPKAVATVRDEWLPALEEQFRDAMRTYGGEAAPAAEAPEPLDEPAPAGTMDGGVPSPGDERAIRVVPTEQEGGGYEIHLPERGIMVTPEGERYRITAAEQGKPEQQDFAAAATEALKRFAENTQQHAVTVLKTAQQVGRAIVRGVFGFFLMLMLSAYLLITSDRIFAFARSLVRPHRQETFDHLLRRIDRGLSGVVRGQLLICLVNGVLSGIGFYILDLDYWPILTLIATVLSIIPIFGAIISSIPAVLVGLQNGMGTAFLVLLWIMGIHQLEANVLNPKIMGDAARVHPVLVIFALLAGEHVYGIAGALLAVPVLSVVQSLFLHFRDIALGPRPGGRTSEMPPAAVGDE